MENADKNVTGDGTKKGPGRPAKHGRALTAAERQMLYRARVRMGASRAIIDPSLASRPELMRELVRCLAGLDADFDEDGHRHSAQRIIREFVTRYDLKL